MVFLLLGTKSETTTNLISGSIYHLLRAPKLRAWPENDPDRATLAVEVFLRFISLAQLIKPHFVRREIPLGGVRLKKGDKIIAMLAAANFDPDANRHADTLDLA